MLNDGMSTEHIARHIGCSSRATSWKSARYNVWSRPLYHEHAFQTATATAANTPGLHNNRISVQTVCNRLRENDLHAQHPMSDVF